MGIDKKAIYISLLLVFSSCIGIFISKKDSLCLNISLGLFTSSLATLIIFTTQFCHKRNTILEEIYIEIYSTYHCLDFIICLLIDINKIIKNKDNKYLIIDTSTPHINRSFVKVPLEKLKSIHRERTTNNLHNKFDSFWFDKTIYKDLNHLYSHIYPYLSDKTEDFSILLICLYEIELALKGEKTNKLDEKEKIEDALCKTLKTLRISLEKINMLFDTKASSYIRYLGDATCPESWENTRKIIHKDNKENTCKFFQMFFQMNPFKDASGGPL